MTKIGSSRPFTALAWRARVPLTIDFHDSQASDVGMEAVRAQLVLGSGFPSLSQMAPICSAQKRGVNKPGEILKCGNLPRGRLS